MLPLTVLQGHLSSLQERTDGDDAALVADAIEEAHYMASLVRNLSTAAKLEAAGAPLRRDSVDLVALIERVAARLPAVTPPITGDAAVISDSSASRQSQGMLRPACANRILLV